MSSPRTNIRIVDCDEDNELSDDEMEYRPDLDEERLVFEGIMKELHESLSEENITSPEEEFIEHVRKEIELFRSSLTYKCRWCTSKFSERVYLDDHIEEMHSIPDKWYLGWKEPCRKHVHTYIQCIICNYCVMLDALIPLSLQHAESRKMMTNHRRGCKLGR